MKLPRRLYARIDGDVGEAFLLASVDVEGREGDEVGVYELKRTYRLKVTRKLVGANECGSEVDEF